MQSAFQYRKKFTKDGKHPLETEWSVGGIVIVSIAVLALAWTGHLLFTLPPLAIGGISKVLKSWAKM